MPISKVWSWPDEVCNAPECRGIYEIGLERGWGIELIYIGRARGAKGIRRRLLDHLNQTGSGDEYVSRCIDHYGFCRLRIRWQEESLWTSAGSMEVDAMERHEEKYGRRPRGNQRTEKKRDGFAGILDWLSNAIEMEE